MRRHRLRLSVFCALLGGALFALACGPADKSPRPDATPAPGATSAAGTTATNDDPSTVIARSALRFASERSYHLAFRLRVQGVPGTFDGDAGYSATGTTYARLSSSEDDIDDAGIAQYLLLLPDLYIQMGDGNWYVQSPWNQGEHTGELIAHGLVEPIIDYPELANALENVKRRADDDAIASGLDRYQGTTAMRDLPSLGGDTLDDTPVTADVWITRDTGLPAKVELTIGGDYPGQIAIDLSGYGETAVAPAIPDGVQPLRDAQFPTAPCTRDELTACLSVQTAITSTSGCEGTTRRICIAPLGMVSPELVDHLAAYYRAEYGLDVTVLRPAAIPSYLEDAKRAQVDAGMLLQYLGELYPAVYNDHNAVLIGLTPVDVYDSSGTWRYVFGVKRTATNPQAIVSSARMDPLFYGEPADEALFFTRTRKMFTKYVGVLYYGLAASSNPQSPMYGSIGGPADVDRMTEGLPVQRG